MENQQQIIKQIAERTKKPEMAIWKLYTETGFEYIESLQKKIHLARSFKKQFGGLVETKQMDTTVTAAFRKIETSPLFWHWWLTVVWAYSIGNESIDNDLFIPENILFKIFKTAENDTKNNKCRKRITAKPAHRACEA